MNIVYCVMAPDDSEEGIFVNGHQIGSIYWDDLGNSPLCIDSVPEHFERLSVAIRQPFRVYNMAISAETMAMVLGEAWDEWTWDDIGACLPYFVEEGEPVEITVQAVLTDDAPAPFMRVSYTVEYIVPEVGSLVDSAKDWIMNDLGQYYIEGIDVEPAPYATWEDVHALHIEEYDQEREVEE